jgi:hypothetical protein
MKKLLIAVTLICSAILVVGAQDGFAWPTYEGGCQTCHGSGFAALNNHSIHVGVTCTACHPGAAGAIPIPTSTCAGCHPAADPGLCPLINVPTHAGIKNTCLACHTSCTNPQPPANDDFDNAIPITVLPFTDSINTSEATPAADDPTDCYGTNVSVWYELTSITNIRIQVDTSYSDYETVVAVYTGTRGNLYLIACWDSPCFTLDVRAGETYYFMVTSYYGMGGNLVFSVDVAPPPPPPLTIDLQVDPVNFVNNGITTVSGTVNSSAPLDYGYVSVQVRQKAGRVFITGYNNTSIYTADGVARWTVKVSGDIGPFKAGKVTVRAIAEGCTSYASCPGGGGGQCVQTPEVSTNVRLQNSKQ